VPRTAKVPSELVSVFDRTENAVREYFARKHEAPETGHIEIDGERYILVRAASLSNEFYDMMAALYAGTTSASNEVTRNLLFHMAHFIGRADARAFHHKMGLESPIEKLSAGPIHFAHTGWAFVDIHPESRPTGDEEFFIVYDHPYSFESTSWIRAGRSSEFPICLMNAGYSSGWCEESFGVKLVASEILCTARGDEHCRFIMAPPSRIHEQIERYMAEHPEIGEQSPIVKVPGQFERMELEQRLRLTEHRYHELFERAGDAIMLVGDGRVTDVNSACLDLLQAGREELVGLSMAHVADRWLPDAPLEELAQAVRDARAGEPQSFRLRIQRTDGTPLETDTSLSALDPSGAYLLAIVRDVTERVREREEREQLEREVRQLQKMEALGTLAGGIAHDFNNLLTGVVGNLSMLGVDLPDHADGHAAIEDARLALERASVLVRKLLAFARTSQNVWERVHIPDVIDDSLRLVGETIDRRVLLDVEESRDPLFVMGDATFLGQVIMNLLLNARDAVMERLKSEGTGYSPRIVVSTGAVALTAKRAKTLGMDRGGSYVCLIIEDNGVGLAADSLQRAFEPFYTTKPIGQGSGLGLSTAFGIIQQHNGWIGIESLPGDYTRVSMYLPRHEAGPRDRAKTRVPRNVGEFPDKGGFETILIVDDEALLRRFASRCLQRLGYSVLEAADGLEAVQIFERHRDQIDLVLLDLTLPRMAGDEVMTHMLRLCPEQRIVVSTGYSTKQLAEQVHAQGAIGFLPKPYDALGLAHEVRKALHRSEPDPSDAQS
jgi:PAS domain S-box-containing protein